MTAPRTDPEHARAGRLAVSLLLVCAVAACTTKTNRDEVLPTVDEAQGFLARVVALAQRRDFEGLCAMSDGNCERLLDTAGRDAVPAAPPTVTSVRLLPSTRTGDQVSKGGVILEMCGTDGAGRPYHSEMLVFLDGSTLRAINPIYWGNTGIADGNSTPASIGPRPSC